jgi:selenocysteine lyase/cysteine desulfurase
MKLDVRVVGSDTIVSLKDGRKRPYINFDNAASTPPFVSVMDEVTAFMPWYSSVHRGTGLKSQLSTQAYEQARETVGRFVGADPHEYVTIFTKNTTESLNVLARRLGLRRGAVVLVSELEHHSNDLPWRAVATVRQIRLTPAGELDLEHFERLLHRYAGRVRIVAVTGASNVTGYMPPLTALAYATHAAGAELVVDAAQLAPHRRIAMGHLDEPGHIDYLAMSAHKLYAPFGGGALVARRDRFLQGAPVFRGGGTVAFVGRRTVDWAPPPDRDEAGSPNVVGAVALAAAIQELERLGMRRIAHHESGLTAHALRRLQTVPGLRLYGDRDPARTSERTGVIAFTLAGPSHQEVATRLGRDYGIGVRNGCFCAHPYVAHLLGLSGRELEAVRAQLIAGDKDQAPGLVRASFGAYNTIAEVDALVEALMTL